MPEDFAGEHEVIDSAEALFRHLYEAHHVEEARDLDPDATSVEPWLRRHAELEREARRAARQAARDGATGDHAGRDHPGRDDDARRGEGARRDERRGDASRRDGDRDRRDGAAATMAARAGGERSARYGFGTRPEGDDAGTAARGNGGGGRSDAGSRAEARDARSASGADAGTGRRAEPRGAEPRGAESRGGGTDERDDGSGGDDGYPQRRSGTAQQRRATDGRAGQPPRGGGRGSRLFDQQRLRPGGNQQRYGPQRQGPARVEPADEHNAGHADQGRPAGGRAWDRSTDADDRAVTGGSAAGGGYRDPLVRAVAEELVTAGYDETAVHRYVRRYVAVTPEGGLTGEAGIRASFLDPVVDVIAEQLDAAIAGGARGSRHDDFGLDPDEEAVQEDLMAIANVLQRRRRADRRT